MRSHTVDPTDERTRLALDRIEANADKIQSLLDEIKADIAKEREARERDRIE